MPFVGMPTGLRSIQIAEDLADGLNDLPDELRASADEVLKRDRGFGIGAFMDSRQRKLLRIVARGKVRDEGEHRAIVDALSDTTLDAALARQLEALLADRERELRRRV